MKKPRLIASLAGACGLLLAVVLVPLPHSVDCSLYLKPRDAAAVYVETPGRIREIHVRGGDWVGGRQPLLTLENPDVELTLTRLAGQRLQLVRKRTSLLQRAFADESAAAELSEVDEALAALDDQLERHRSEADRLKIAAPAAGCVIPVPGVARPPRESPHLPAWWGSPLEDRNLQAFLAKGIPVCHIGDPRRLEAVLAIDQADLEFVRSGQEVELALEPLPGRKFHSRLGSLSQLDLKVLPPSLSAKTGGRLITRTDSQGQERPYSTTYLGSAPLEDVEGLLFVGATGRARIHTGYQTLAQRAWRYLCQTFNFQA